MRELTEEQVRAEIAALRDRLGSIRALAEHLGLSPTYAFDVVKGRRPPGADFLKAIGVRKEVIVRYVRD